MISEEEKSQLLDAITMKWLSENVFVDKFLVLELMDMGGKLNHQAMDLLRRLKIGRVKTIENNTVLPSAKKLKNMANLVE
jgi:hypothetical protein